MLEILSFVPYTRGFIPENEESRSLQRKRGLEDAPHIDQALFEALH